MLAAVEAEGRREQLGAEALRGQLGGDRVHGGDLALELGVGDDQPLEAEAVALALDRRAGGGGGLLDELLGVVVDARRTPRRRAAGR